MKLANVIKSNYSKLAPQEYGGQRYQLIITPQLYNQHLYNANKTK